MSQLNSWTGGLELDLNKVEIHIWLDFKIPEVGRESTRAILSSFPFSTLSPKKQGHQNKSFRRNKKNLQRKKFAVSKKIAKMNFRYQKCNGIYMALSC